MTVSGAHQTSPHCPRRLQGRDEQLLQFYERESRLFTSLSFAFGRDRELNSAEDLLSDGSIDWLARTSDCIPTPFVLVRSDSLSSLLTAAKAPPDHRSSP